MSTAVASARITANPPPDATASAYAILWSLTLAHLLNDVLQALIPALYPLLKESFTLSYAQIGLITFTFQMVGSVLQPLIGHYTDQRPQPYFLPVGMGISLIGLILLAIAPHYHSVLLAAGMVGLGSAIFHPEASRLARSASGGRHGLAQSLFQVGGNAGTALGPLLAAWIIVPRGQIHVLWFTLLALAGMLLLARVGAWYSTRLAAGRANRTPVRPPAAGGISRHILLPLGVLLILMFSKFIYLAAMTNYYTFYLIQKFGVSIQESQHYLFIFLISGAVGTIVGGPLGDRIGRKAIIWVSILGMAPFALLQPHVNLLWTVILSASGSLIMASAFPAILVYATELLPHRVGLVAGLCFGLAFGIAGVGSALLGKMADATSIRDVMLLCSFLPLLGILTYFLPATKRKAA